MTTWTTDLDLLRRCYVVLQGLSANTGESLLEMCSSVESEPLETLLATDPGFDLDDLLLQISDRLDHVGSHPGEA